MILGKIKKHSICIVFSLILLISAGAASSKTVVVGGMPFGIRFQTGEVSVIKKNSFSSFGKTVSPAEDAGIAENDVITKVNSKTIESMNDFISSIDTKSNEPINITVNRNGKEIVTRVLPKLCDETGKYMLGILLKDSSAGIGTVTYINEGTQTFAGLGHGICDTNSGKIIDIKQGYVSKVTISGITKGASGSPGELRGRLSAEKCGKVISNTESGVYGIFTELPNEEPIRMITAEIDEVKLGKATILCTLDDNRRKEYNIEIIDIDSSVSSRTKNYVIKVTDDRLLKKTGGIVQGMSGSPIIQDGKLIGAVTHVFVNDPTRGYGIFIENMMKTAENMTE